MSAATRAKTAKERAKIAAEFIRKGGETTRAFDDCFEMGDANEVIQNLQIMTLTSPKLRANIWRYLSAFSYLKPENK